MAFIAGAVFGGLIVGFWPLILPRLKALWAKLKGPVID